MERSIACLCVHCNQPIPSTRKHSALCCSNECLLKKLAADRKRAKANFRHNLTCIECGSQFWNRYKRKKCCSDLCFSERQNRLARIRLQAGGMSPSNKEAVCKFCDKPFITKRAGQIFCSPKCKERESNQRTSEAKKEERAKVLHTIQCVVCEKSFQNYSANKICCSPKCALVRETYLRRVRVRERGTSLKKQNTACQECGTLFITDMTTQIFCSDKCHNADAERQAKEDCLVVAPEEIRQRTAEVIKSWTAERLTQQNEVIEKALDANARPERFENPRELVEAGLQCLQAVLQA